MNIIITGGNKGIGRALTEFYLKAGHQVFTVARSPFQGQRPLGLFHHFQGDAADPRALLEFKSFVEEQCTEIDLLINNAAVHLEQPAPDLTEIDFDKIIDTYRINSVGPLMVVQTFLAMIKASKKKLIVNVSSEAGSISAQPRSREYGYCMSKTALNMATKILANRLNPEGIRVMALHPGWVRTDMGGSSASYSAEDSAKGLIDTIERYSKLSDPLYIDHLGKLLAW
jgi:NAD(P)-dependent dehydrogenase (short-subunit alcohol dehydrogenase family)